MTTTETQTYVSYDTPGIFMPETFTREMPDRDPEKTARELPASAYAFRFHDIIVTTVTAGGNDTELRSDPLNKSARYYINAEKVTAASLASLPGDYENLLSQMLASGWDYVLRCRAGNYQPPLGPGDQIISIPDETAGDKA